MIFGLRLLDIVTLDPYINAHITVKRLFDVDCQYLEEEKILLSGQLNACTVHECKYARSSVSYEFRIWKI